MANSDCNNCSQDTTTTCVSCSDLELQMQSFCTEGCKEYPPSDCVIYVGDDIINSTLDIKNGDNLTTVINELAKNNLNVTVTLTWNATTRQLCLVKNGNVVSCQTIADADQQYLAINGTELEIWKPGSPDVLINSVDLAEIFTETELIFNSTTLSVIQSGTNGHTLSVNIPLSTDIGNAISYGSDGKIYAPQQAQELTDVVITNTDCVTWSKVYSGGKITLTPTYDWDCINEQTCPLCVESTSTPINLTVTPA